MSRVELISSHVILGKLSTNIRISQTRPYLTPVLRISDVVPQPLRKPIQPVFLVPSTLYRIRAIRARDNKREDKEDEKESYEYSHAYEVKGQQTLSVPISTHEAS